MEQYKKNNFLFAFHSLQWEHGEEGWFIIKNFWGKDLLLPIRITYPSFEGTTSKETCLITDNFLMGNIFFPRTLVSSFSCKVAGWNIYIIIDTSTIGISVWLSLRSCMSLKAHHLFSLVHYTNIWYVLNKKSNIVVATLSAL